MWKQRKEIFRLEIDQKVYKQWQEMKLWRKTKKNHEKLKSKNDAQNTHKKKWELNKTRWNRRYWDIISKEGEWK